MLIDNNNFTRVGNNIIFIALEKRFGAESLLKVIYNARVFGRVKRVDTENLLNFFDTFIC